jgi:hypothetical protein
MSSEYFREDNKKYVLVDRRLFFKYNNEDKWTEIEKSSKLEFLIREGIDKIPEPARRGWRDKVWWPVSEFSKLARSGAESLVMMLLIVAGVALILAMLLAAIHGIYGQPAMNMYPAEIEFKVGDKTTAKYVISDLDENTFGSYTVKLPDKGVVINEQKED